MKTIVTLLAALVIGSASASAEVIEKWEFSEADGSTLDQMLSSQGTPLANKSKPSARIRNQRLELTGEGEEDSIFLTFEFAGKNPQAGVYEVSWEFPSAAFAYTHEVKGKAFAGLDVRDTGPTIFKGTDDRVIAGVRIGYLNGAIELQFQDHEGRFYEQIAKLERVVLPDALYVRILLDYDNAGQPGSMKIFLRLGDEPEICPIEDGVLPADVELKGYRLMQQITNGGTNWQKGDYVTIDNFTLSKVDAE